MIRKLKFLLCVLICRWFCEIGSRDGVIWNDARRSSDWRHVWIRFSWYKILFGCCWDKYDPRRSGSCSFRLSVVRGWRAGIDAVVNKYSKNNSACRICRYFPDGFHAGFREGYGIRQEGRRAFGTENIRTRHLFINGRARIRLARTFSCARVAGRAVLSLRYEKFQPESIASRLKWYLYGYLSSERTSFRFISRIFCSSALMIFRS